MVVLASLMVVMAGIAVDQMGMLGHASRPDAKQYDGQQFRVVRVVDGDTLIIDARDEKNGQGQTTIRLWGVDTPETVKPNTPVQHFGKQASQYSKHALEGQMVKLELEQDTRDKYGRLLAFVILPDGTMHNRNLVSLGYAYADPRFNHKYKREFQQLQDHARKQKLGLWKDITEADLPEYLRGKIKLSSAKMNNANIAMRTDLVQRKIQNMLPQTTRKTWQPAALALRKPQRLLRAELEEPMDDDGAKGYYQNNCEAQTEAQVSG